MGWSLSGGMFWIGDLQEAFYAMETIYRSSMGRRLSDGIQLIGDPHDVFFGR